MVLGLCDQTGVFHPPTWLVTWLADLSHAAAGRENHQGVIRGIVWRSHAGFDQKNTGWLVVWNMDFM